MKITLNWLHENAARNTPHGSVFTAAQLKLLGISGHLKAGWMATLIGRELSDLEVEQFIAAKNITKASVKKHIEASEEVVKVGK